MKNAVTIFVSTLLGIVSMAIIMTIMGQTTRAVELQTNLSYCTEKSLERAMEENDIVVGEQELLAEQMQLLAEALDTDSAARIQIMKADTAQGILSVHVQEIFGQINGSTGEKEWDRTVIWDRQQEDRIEQ